MSRDIFKLATGGVVSSALLFASIPFIARLYTPEDFTLYAAFIAVFDLLSVVSTLKLEIAITVAKDDDEAKSILAVSMLSVILIGFMIPAIIIFVMILLDINTFNKLPVYIVSLLPLSIISAGAFSILQSWAVRKRHFHDIAVIKVHKSIAEILAQGVGSFIFKSATGLIAGHISNNIAGTFKLYGSTLKGNHFTKINLSVIRHILTKYKNYPKFAVLEAFLNSASVNFSIIVILYLNKQAEIGQMYLAMRIMSAPVSLIGGAISQVFLANAPKMSNDDNLLRLEVLAITDRLIIFGVFPILVGAVFAPLLIPEILGQQWDKVSEFIVIMTFWYGVQIIASPISTVLYIKNAQKKSLIIQTVGLSIRISAVLIAHLFFSGYEIEGFIISGGIFYFYYLHQIYLATNVSIKDIFGIIARRKYMLGVVVVLYFLVKNA